MLKNPTPRGIAFFTSLLLSLFIGILSYVSHPDILSALLIALVSFCFGFFVFYYALEFFIYRKIKLVYKNIHQLKTQKGASVSNLIQNLDPISGVNDEVVEWAKDQRTEIEQLRKMETYRKEFLGNVSHELKTPLFAIQGYIDTILEGDVEDKEFVQHFLKKAALNGDRLSMLIQDLENISQLESGELTMQVDIFDIHDTISDVFDSLESRAAEKKITFSFKEGCDRPFIVEADKNRIRQVILNLIVNSIKYGNEGGYTKVGLYDMDENILIEITDNGIGVPEEHLPRLFERFYRVDKSRSRDEGGTGLGLSIVKHIIEAHHQTINVRSAIDVGTTFGFTLTKA